MIYKLKTELNFGKYEGITVEKAIETDPDWVAWAADNIDWFELDEDAIEYLDIVLWSDED